MNATDYFQSQEGYFWQWEDDSETVAIPGGRTIAYRDYLLRVLKLLQPRGIPRFGTLLLTVLATNHFGKQDLINIMDKLRQDLLAPYAKYHAEVIEVSRKFLLELTKLPAHYKEGPLRLLVFQAIFPQVHNRISAEDAGRLLDSVSENPEAFDEAMVKKAYDPRISFDDLRPLYLMRATYPTVDAILKKIGRMPDLPEEEILPPADHSPPAAAPKDFVSELLDDPRTFPVGALMRHIWSGLDIPLHHRLPSLQPFGGVSDLSNKGDLHRLLVSELAHDDLVFLSRLANNEALYFNREMPPQADDRERVILIDVSLKSWGTPRVVALALMLAIARHPKTDIPCSAFAVGNDCRPLAFDTVHEVIKSLLELDLCLHPLAGLEQFFRDHPEKRAAELIFIASEETLKLPVMQQARSDYEAFIDYWIPTGNQGKIDLYKKHGAHRKHIKTMHLPLLNLWKKEAPAPRLPAPETIRAQYPLLFPGPSRPKALLPLGEELFLVTPERNLLRRAGSQTPYWELLYENLPAGADYFEVGRMESGELLLLAFNHHQKELTLLNIGTGEKKCFILEKRVSSFIFHQDYFFVPDSSLAFSLGEEGPVQFSAGRGGESLLQRTIRELDELRKTERAKAEKNYRVGGQILKNIKEVYLNQAGNLMFNIHELTLHNHHFTLKANKVAAAHKTVEARQTERNEFTFPDGSQVLVHPAGLLTLRSSDEAIPPIYMSSVLDQSLGLAAGPHISGNEWFFPKENTENPRLPSGHFHLNYLVRFVQQIR